MQQLKKQDTLSKVIMKTEYEDTDEEEIIEETEDTLISVKVLRSKGQASVVAWDDSGRHRRTIVPRDTVLEGEDGTTAVQESSLDMGIPYGVDWESRLKNSYIITGAKVAEQLEVSGIWTKEDYEKNPSRVQSAVLGAAREILTELSGIARKIPN